MYNNHGNDVVNEQEVHNANMVHKRGDPKLEEFLL